MPGLTKDLKSLDLLRACNISKTRQKLEDDGRVAGVILLPQHNEQLAQPTRRFCMKRHATMASDELGNAFVLEVTRFRTNKSCLYFVNNNTSFHNKLFIKFHQFTDNNTSLSSATLG